MCQATTFKNKQCKLPAEPGSSYCRVHNKQRAFVFDKEKNDLARAEYKAYKKRQQLREIKYKEAWQLAVDNRDTKMMHALSRNRFNRESLPESHKGMVCGAKTRSGTPCKRTDLYKNCRCKLHGGSSTGPRSKAGKKKVSQNLPRVAKQQTKPL